MSNPALSAGSSLDELMTHMVFRIGCISGSNPRATLLEWQPSPQIMALWWVEKLPG